eukprot:758699-Hanusia_phi.AAC.1
MVAGPLGHSSVSLCLSLSLRHKLSLRHAHAFSRACQLLQVRGPVHLASTEGVYLKDPSPGPGRRRPCPAGSSSSSPRHQV